MIVKQSLDIFEASVTPREWNDWRLVVLNWPNSHCQFRGFVRALDNPRSMMPRSPKLSQKPFLITGDSNASQSEVGAGTSKFWSPLTHDESKIGRQKGGSGETDGDAGTRGATI